MRHQARHWMFGPSELAEHRTNSNIQASETLQRYAQEANIQLPLMLSVEDEQAIIRFYLLRIGRLVRAFGLPNLVETTAMTLMKRFYIRNSCMQFHPKLIMLTSIYLSAKAENYPVPLKHFCAQVNESTAKQGAEAPSKATTPSAARGDVAENIIRDLEFGMVQSLDFELGLHSPHRALYGFILDIQSVQPTLSREDVMGFAGAVQAYLQVARLTDVEFVYAPAHIALAACWMCNAPSRKEGAPPISGKDLVQLWLGAKAERGATLHESELKDRVAWREKKRAIDEEIAKHEKNGANSNSTIPTEESTEEPTDALNSDGFEIPISELETTFDAIATRIRDVLDPNVETKAPPRPFVDVERVKQIDLALRQCLQLFEKGQVTSSRKRASDDHPSSTKRQRTDSDSDNDP
ncbi:hypothetical protein MVES1_003327 [Malassezia vespertilionis]|uniref:uncharacterized protein n=1 Tax=Malassezia vespertilionis TaxID=2020962 RepID=UPI0024B2327C|nr:uncharacterized protein MVES1_003327 [Malassezia vespertilionis]WFD07958.1 hypothetical protein MVES1_003327 [Malassezia vespertilionis]